MDRLSDRAIEILNDLHTERLSYNSEYLPLIEAAHKLAEYEASGLEPEICAEYKKFEDEVVSKNVTFARIVELMNAESEGRLVVLPCKVGNVVFTIKENYLDCECCLHKDRASYQATIQRVACDMDGVHCPLTVEEHTVQGFNVVRGKTGEAEVSEPGEWGYEGLETFCGFDGKWYLTRDEAEAKLKAKQEMSHG